jgi:hypothetical protein
VFSLREDTSIYTGAGRAIKRMKEAVKELTAGRNPAPRWSADISSAEQSYTTKLKEYDKNQERTGRIDLVRLGELAASADAFALACLGARAELERAALKHAAGDPFDPSRSLAQLDAIAMAAVLQLQKEIAAGGIDAELKLKPIRDRFRLKVIRERTLDREPSSMWAETLKDATNDLPADWETERKRAFGDWMKTTSLDERLKEWARRARDMPKGAVDYLAATRKVKEAIGRARGGALAFLPKTKGGLLYACLDDIALHVAATTARYHSLFPGEL